MALLPQDPRSQKRFLGIILVAGGLAAFYMYVYQPRQEELQELEDRVAELEQHNRVAEARTGNLDGLRARLEELERTFSALQALVPPQGEVPRLYERIAQEVEALGMDLNAVQPANPEPVESGYYHRQEWDVQVEGEYHDLGRFLARVASFPRIVRPMVQDIRPTGGEGSGRVVAQVALEMFVLPSDTAREEGDDG